MMYLQVAAGLVILLVCGELLVRGAVSLAEHAGVSKLLIGFTVVAFGTSAPELVVSVQAALDGMPGIAFGNVVGSNIANILLVMGLPALIYPLFGDPRSATRDTCFMLAASLMLIAFAWMGVIGFWQGVIFVTFLITVIVTSYIRARKEGAKDVDEALEEYEQNMPKNLGFSLLFILMGLVGLVLGSHLLIGGAEMIARAAGVSDEIIGLTLVALGTSLPELATSIIAAVRRHGDVAIGNVLGSNFFNIAAILGITVIIEPMAAPLQILHFDLWVMLFVSFLLVPLFLLRIRIGRVVGIIFCTAYVAYVLLQFYGMSGTGVT
tara:strand:+ start:8116 stop:9081 length:966 start_codon:yes stop_codon:yes gene_type:complete